MVYTDQQNLALAAIDAFFKSDRSVFILKGYAGTGKTTLIRPILDLADSVGREGILMAPTGRAAKILSDKTGHKATTIHKAIYMLSKIEAVEGDEKTESKVEYRFPLRQDINSRRSGMPISPRESVLIIDEASMVSSRRSVNDLFMFGSGVLLSDVLSCARLDEGGKILFVGDPAQLPPVGDPDSYALDPAYFSERGISVDFFELTDIVRQGSDSVILSNSIKLRNLIQSDIRTDLVLDRKQDEVEDIEAMAIAPRFHDICPTPSTSGPVVICFTNKQASEYNAIIRSLYYPDSNGSVRVGDRLIIVGNNYSDQNREVLNGEFCTVVDFSQEVEKQIGLVYIEEGKEQKRCVRFELSFRNVSLLFEDGMVVNTKIIDTLLDSTKPNITYQEQCALMSNFRLRHKGLKEGSPEFLLALKSDPYYNALRAKYGYAITFHKAQGGEWDTTFVDFSGRGGLSKDCLRWSYTAATRARKEMFGYSMHNIPKLKARVIEIVSTTSVPAEFYPVNVDVPTGPYNDPAHSASLRAKYWQVADALEGSGYQVSGIDHKPYREIYSISDMDGHVYKCHAMYNKAGIVYPFISPVPGETPEDILSLINTPEPTVFPFSYSPSNTSFRDLHSKVQSICDECGISIVNVVEHLNNYKINYYLQTSALFAYLVIFFNGKGVITYIAPYSEIGKQDTKLTQLVEALRQ